MLTVISTVEAEAYIADVNMCFIRKINGNG